MQILAGLLTVLSTFLSLSKTDLRGVPRCVGFVFYMGFVGNRNRVKYSVVRGSERQVFTAAYFVSLWQSFD